MNQKLISIVAFCKTFFYLLSGVTVEVGAEAGATAARKKRRRRRKRRNAKGQARLAVRTTPHQAHPLVRSQILSWLSIQQLFKLQNLAWNKYLPRCMRLPTRPAILLPLSRSENCTLAIYPPVGSALRHPTFHTIISQSFKILHACFHISGCVWYVVIYVFFWQTSTCDTILSQSIMHHRNYGEPASRFLKHHNHQHWDEYATRQSYCQHMG